MKMCVPPPPPPPPPAPALSLADLTGRRWGFRGAPLAGNQQGVAYGLPAWLALPC